MTQQEAIQLLEETHTMQKGHFRLTSGRHADTYMQCARLFEDPDAGSAVCSALAEVFENDAIDLVVGPALGGIILAYGVGCALGVRNVFAERDEAGKMVLRRGFAIQPGERVLVVEDAVTTGGSVKEVIELVRAQGATVAGVGCVVDRSNGKVDFGVPLKALLQMDIPSWPAEECPLCAQGVPIVKPGSRKV